MCATTPRRAGHVALKPFEDGLECRRELSYGQFAS
jgi:hypothetical protein